MCEAYSSRYCIFINVRKISNLINYGIIKVEKILILCED
jgi:hypothetical protein